MPTITQFKAQLLAVIHELRTDDLTSLRPTIQSIIDDYSTKDATNVHAYMECVDKAVMLAKHISESHQVEYDHVGVLEELLTDAQVLYLPRKVLYPKRHIDLMVDIAQDRIGAPHGVVLH